MKMQAWSRRLALCAVILGPLAACGGGDIASTSFAKPNYDYLTPMHLNVASIDIDDSVSPVVNPREVSRLAPTSPVDALRQMAQDRLQATGSTGHAVFVIDEATIYQVRDKYEGKMTVHLDVTTSDGARSGYAEARVTRTRSITNDGPNATRAELNDLITQMMADMNVEFEFQVRRSLGSYLQSDAPAGVVPPPPIQTEDLTPPLPVAP